MKLEGSAVWYLLSREFTDVYGEGLKHGSSFDYPILYDDTADMSGHTVLVPGHERPQAGPTMRDVLCVCMSEQAARSALDSGLPVVQVKGGVTFQHLYNYMQRAFVRNERLDAQLWALVDAYADYQTLLDACVDTWGFPCSLIDEQYRVVCQSSGATHEQSGDGVSDASVLESDAVDLFMASRSYRYLRSTRNVFTVPGSGDLLMKNVFYRSQLVGSLAMHHRGDMLSARYVRFLLAYLASFVEELYARKGSFGLESLGREHVKAAIAGALGGGAAECAALEQALLREGHRERGVYAVLCLARSFTNEGVDERAYLVRRLESDLPRSYGFVAGSNLFLLAEVGEEGGAERGEARHALPVVTRENLLKAGISRPFTGMENLSGAVSQAQVALAYGNDVDPTNWGYHFDDYVLPWLTSRSADDVSFLHVCHPALPVLMHYDEEHGSDLLSTLRMFVECRYNATLASERLFVARSTLLNRLERIDQLVDVDLDDFDSRLYLAISLYLAREFWSAD